MDPLHQSQPILTAGAPLELARAVLILLHGRGATADSILSLARELDSDHCAYLAPQAANNTWYPYRFLDPIERNEPWLSSALQVIDDLVARVNASGFPAERLMLLGFSQGACLTLEYAARRARRYGGVVGLSGGLIGPEVIPQRYAGAFDGAPIFLGCSDVDPHIPLERVHETTRMLRQLGADVTERIYPGMAHSINHEEVKYILQLQAAVVRTAVP
jgi:predicted esterase